MPMSTSISSSPPSNLAICAKAMSLFVTTGARRQVGVVCLDQTHTLTLTLLHAQGFWGEALEDALLERGIVVLGLPARYCELNPIEFTWNVSKAYTKRMNARLNNMDTSLVPFLFSRALRSVTHRQVANTYQHCGYSIEQETLAELEAAGC